LGLINNIEFHGVEYDSIWMRDNGPIFFKDQEGIERILSFIWKEWGYMTHEKKCDLKYDPLLPAEIAKKLNVPCHYVPFGSEGGDREFNGKGSLIACKDVELDRNPGKSISDLEVLYKEQLNVSNIIWLKHALADDAQTFYCPLPNTDIYTCHGTGGHVDEFARFVSPTTILLAQVHPEEQNTPLGSITHQVLEENFQILSSLKDQDGKPFHIVRINLPPPLFHSLTIKDPIYETLENLKYTSGKPLPDEVKVVAATSYCNFLISNGVILMPSYYKEGRPRLFKETDDSAKQVLQSLFPDRVVIQITAEAVNFGGGGIHCITQQQPQ